MRILVGAEEEEAMGYMNAAAGAARGSSCLRSKCGSVIVKRGKLLGSGFNSPPGNKSLKKCLKDDLPSDFKSDKTCCVHAEQRAIIDACKRNPKDLVGSTLYFTRINEKGERIPSGDPYCTICSKLTYDVGISEFVLWHEKGLCAYETENYNDLSFRSGEKV